MRVLQIHNFFQFFGGEDQVTLNEKALLEKSDLTLKTFYADSAEVKQYSLLQKALFFIKIFYNSELLKRLKKEIQEFKPDVVHIHNIYPLISIWVYRLIQKEGIPIVQSFHDHRLATLCPQGNAYIQGAICNRCFKGNFLHTIKNRCIKNNMPLSTLYALALGYVRLFKVLQKNITLGIYFNDYMKSHLQALGFKENQLVKKPHFYEPQTPIAPVPPQKYFLYVGALSDHKGILTLIEAFSRIQTDYSLKICGTGALHDHIFQHIKNTQNIELMGFVQGEKKEALIKQAYYTVVPSESNETFGMTILESIAHSVPVIATDVGGFPDLVIHKETGFLVPIKDADSLQSTITSALENPETRQQQSKSAFQYYEETFTPSKNRKTLLDIYAAAIAIHKRNK